jgi:micrococcal nuclease
VKTGALPAAILLVVAAAAAGSAAALDTDQPDRRPPPAVCAPLPEMTRVARVIDGDTVTVESGCDAPPLTVRIIGINTPETVKRGTPVQCWGPQASTFAHRTLDRQRVMLAADAKAGAADLYGRRLAHLFVLDREAGAELYGLLALRAGAAEARTYGHHHTYESEYTAAAIQARKAHRGAWRACPRPFAA